MWQEDGPGVVIIQQRAPVAGRLFGVPFAAAGGWFLYQFAGSVVGGGLTIAGWILLPVMTAAFLVPGGILLFGKKRTRLDIARREATEEFDFLVYTRRKVTRIPPDAHVMLRYEKGGGTNQYDAHVYLVPDDRSLVLLALFDAKEKSAAFELAQKAARLFGIDVQDRRVEGGEVTAGGVVVDRLGPDDAD